MSAAPISAAPKGSFTVNNLFNNENIKCLEKKGQYEIYEHQADLSVSPAEAMMQYFMDQKNVKRRQVLCKLENSAVKLQAGAMQWIAGSIEMNADVGGVKGLLGKMAKSVVTGESVVKPIFSGSGYLMLEPTYNHLMIENVADWGGGIVLDDGLFLACDTSLKESITKRGIVTAALSGEGMFNLTLSGDGLVVLESPVPRAELYEITLEHDTLKIDGNMAIAWSASLSFSVENSTKSVIDSIASNEGVVNVYRGTGKVLMAPTLYGTTMSGGSGPQQKTAEKAPSGDLIGSIVGGLLK